MSFVYCDHVGMATLEFPNTMEVLWHYCGTSNSNPTAFLVWNEDLNRGMQNHYKALKR